MTTTQVPRDITVTAEVPGHSGKAGPVPATAAAGERSQTITYAEITAFAAEAAARFPKSLRVTGSHLPDTGYGTPGEHRVLLHDWRAARSPRRSTATWRPAPKVITSSLAAYCSTARAAAR
jgi:hypothetical protein